MENSALKATWSAFVRNIGNMAKFSNLPENKRYRIIHLKEEGLMVCAKWLLLWPFYCRENFKKICWNKLYCGQGPIRPIKRNIFTEDSLLHKIPLSNRKLNSTQVLKQWSLTSNVSVCPRTVRGRLLEIGLRSFKSRPKPLLTEFQRKRSLTWTMYFW